MDDKSNLFLNLQSPWKEIYQNGEYLCHYLRNDFHQEIVFLRAQTAVNTQSVTIVWQEQAGTNDLSWSKLNSSKPNEASSKVS